MQLESYDLITLAETSWDEMHNWSIANDVYELFRRDRQERRGEDVVLYVKEWIDYTELSLKSSDGLVESLWVKIMGQATKGSLVVGVYYRLPDKEDDVDKLLLQLQEAPCSQALILLGDFNHAGICWKSSTASCKQSRRLLERVKDNF
ncbi:hypothetical protein GRJ2_000749500 [Grus japonensis]|uniref:Endonuclease/exonuclease/phosphatase domain-containing protein n=1 Tax=Grus japonensis TaxID=30415 RepID=A0ABC9WF52_GRUJA